MAISKLKLTEASQEAKEIIFAKQRLFEFRDKSNKLLAKLLAHQKGSSGLPESMKSTRGELVHSVKEKLQVFVDSYEELCKSLQPAETEVDNFLNSIRIPRMTQEHGFALGKPITPQEIERAILKLKSNRSPGLDGLTAKIYENYRDLIIPYLQELFDCCSQHGAIPSSWKEARLVLIWKSDKNVVDPASYHPISVLNRDYKIMTSIFADRLNNILGLYGLDDQTGFIRG